jgi:hypothetical protein
MPRSEHAGRHVLVRWLFLRLLAVVHLVAFASLWAQIHGLVGERGIAPAGEMLEQARRWFERDLGGTFAWWKVPTLAWLGSGDTALDLMCGGGVVAAVLLGVGLCPPLLLLVLWALYLSLSTIGDVFLGYQWDALLLETTLLAVFVAPWGWFPRLRTAREPSIVALWLPRLLLFKLMFSSGVVKVNHPGEWRDLTALDFHFWTQPLPHVVGWYAQQLPVWFRHVSVAATLAIELVGPFLIFFNPRGWRLPLYLGLVGLDLWLAGGWPGPMNEAALVLGAALLDERVLRRFLPASMHAPDEARLGAFVLLAGLLLTITSTGNYGFFTLLSFTLCVTLLDDGALRRVLPDRLLRRLAVPEARAHGGWTPALAGALYAVAWVPLSLLHMASLWPDEFPRGGGKADRALAWVDEVRLPLLRATGPFDSVNGYGLFARMTTDRPEVIVEGSADGATWKPYTFRWKPVDPAARPGWAAFHMPRLDWQLWFAGLARTCQRAPWFLDFAKRLLENDPAVLALMDGNPFPDAPPRFVRARRQQYGFTTPEERERTGRWWTVRDDGIFCPQVGLDTVSRR